MNEEKEYLDIKHSLLCYKPKEFIVDMYIEALKRLDKVNEYTNRIIEIIKDQPSNDKEIDKYFIKKLISIKKIINDENSMNEGYKITKIFGYEIPNSDKELRKLIENSNWNFIAQTIRDLQKDNEELEEENDELKKLIKSRKYWYCNNNAINYYLKTLLEKQSMPDEAVIMFNILEGNIK